MRFLRLSLFVLFLAVGHSAYVLAQDVDVVPDAVVKLPQLLELDDGNSSSVPSTLTSIPSEDESGDTFFDAEALVPNTSHSRKGPPRKLNPQTEPASRLVLVNKNHSARSTPATMVAAERAMALGRYEAAYDIFDRLYERNKRDPNILMGRAVALQNLGRDQAAIRAYEELLDIRPDNVEARVNMLGVVGQEFPSIALRQLLALFNENSDNVAVAAQIAVVQARLGYYEDALKHLGIAASYEPKNPSHVFNMAIIADRAGYKSQAIELYESALEIDTLYAKGQGVPRDSVFERLAVLR